MARRIAAILLLEPKLGASYRAVSGGAGSSGFGRTAVDQDSSSNMAAPEGVGGAGDPPRHHAVTRSPPLGESNSPLHVFYCVRTRLTQRS
jgi:hypothetical protein